MKNNIEQAEELLLKFDDLGDINLGLNSLIGNVKKEIARASNQYRQGREDYEIAMREFNILTDMKINAFIEKGGQYPEGEK